MLYFSLACALGSFLVLTVLVSSQFCCLETCILTLGNYCMTALQKPWGGLMQFVTACEGWSTYRSQWLGRRDGGGKDVWTCAFCLSAIGCVFWLRLEELTCVIFGLCWFGFSGYCAHQLVSLTNCVICQIHFWIFLDLLFSSNFCTYARPFGLVWLSWNEQNFPLIPLVKQDQTLLL